MLEQDGQRSRPVDHRVIGVAFLALLKCFWSSTDLTDGSVRIVTGGDQGLEGDGSAEGVYSDQEAADLGFHKRQLVSHYIPDNAVSTPKYSWIRMSRSPAILVHSI